MNKLVDQEEVDFLAGLLDAADTAGLLERLRLGHSLQAYDYRTLELAGVLLYYTEFQNEPAARVLLAALDSHAHSGDPAWDALRECARAGRDMWPLPFPTVATQRAADAIEMYIAAFYDDCDIYHPALVIREDEEEVRGLPAILRLERSAEPVPIIVGKPGSRLFYPPLPGCVRLVEMPWNPDEQAERETLRRSGT